MLLLVLDVGKVEGCVTVAVDFVDLDFVYLSVTVVLILVEGGVGCVLGEAVPVTAGALPVVV